MATLRVIPLPDGASIRGNWQVKVNGSRKSQHTKKTAAVSKARKVGNVGDTLHIHRVDGTKQDTVTIQGSQSESSSTEPRGAMAEEWAEQTLDFGL